MSDRHETIADIIAEKRALADRLEHGMAVAKECKELITHRTAQAIIDSTRREADRVDAAHKRERVVCARMREAVEKVIEIADREWDAFRETSAMWKMREICTAALATPATAEKSSAVGDAAKLREALTKILNLTGSLDEDCAVDPVDICDIARAALAAPPRNCDRFASAEEAWNAYDEWVESYRAKGETEPLNEFGWLFAPATTPNQNTQEEN